MKDTNALERALETIEAWVSAGSEWNAVRTVSIIEHTDESGRWDAVARVGDANYACAGAAAQGSISNALIKLSYALQER